MMYSEAFENGAVNATFMVRRRVETADAGPRVLVIDATRRLIEATAGGHALLSDGRVLMRSGDRIEAATRIDSARLIAGLSRTLEHGHARIMFNDAGDRLEADLAAVHNETGASPTIMVILKPAQDARRRHLADAERRFGLTPAESRLLAALFEGCSIPQAAERVSIARTTARTHLQRIFDKTGVRRQGDLLRLVGCA